MQLVAYISDLLYRHDCVVVPEFGAFLTRRVSAQYFESSNSFYPPKKGISFNSQILQNDGLLINYVSSVEKVPYADAQQLVRNEVRRLDLELENSKSITLPKIGRIALNEEGVKVFTPMYLVNYLPEAFGLSSQELYQVDRAVIDQENDSTAVETPVIAINEVKKAEAQNEGSNNFQWWKYAAVGALLLGLSYVGYNQYEVTSIKNQDLVQQMAEQKLDQQIEQASFLITDPIPQVAVKVAQPKKNYHIVAGAFRDPKNADKRVVQLKNAGHDAKRIGINKYGLHNVAFSSFHEKNDAINELYRLRKLGFDQAWLLTGQLNN
ncbi:sporulation protein [Nonlabens sp. MIC269]|uniref:HU domain-containing protein n=1 Tax=Nonlabens sp. MIC269 TaxID=1476901 RepID=UPI000720F0D8|nr:SPOR domain-containing protein [Nonlabens sp. MIC269]ALM21278.1 sporulation protein [Nonlabens sp. MIC269]